MSLLRNMVARLQRQGQTSTPENNPLPAHEEHGENFVIDKVISVDRKPEVIRGGKGYIHGSSLIGICPRRYALTILAGEAGRKATSPQDRIMWAIGRAVEKHIRQSFITAMKRKGIIGKWVCSCGKSKREGEFSPTEKCPTCRTSLLKYKEIALLDHSARITGNPDLPYIRPDNHKVRVVEIKSKKQEAFAALTAPEANHITQASIYRRLLQLNDMDVDDYVTIIYGSKDYTFSGRPYKEYHVLIEPHHESLLDDMWIRAGKVKQFLSNHEEGRNQLPSRIPACTTRTAPTAKACDQCQACFAHE